MPTKIKTVVAGMVALDLWGGVAFCIRGYGFVNIGT